MLSRIAGQGMGNRERGVTLVETLVVVTIIAILAAVAVPSFRGMVEKRRLVAAAESIYAHLQFARSESIKLARSANLHVSVRAGTPWCLGISNATANCDCTSANACIYGPDLDANGAADLERNLLGSDFPNITMATNTTDMQINSRRGSITSGAGTVTLTSNSGYILKIVASSFGRIRICSPAGSSNVSGYSTTSCP